MSAMRSGIYYWKCDRPAALHGVACSTKADGRDASIEADLLALLANEFAGPIQIKPAGGKGNHRTYLLDHGRQTMFVRVEDGPEGDTHLEMESLVMAEVAKTGVPVPRVFFTDATRLHAPFSVQVIEYFDCPDLNHAYKKGCLPLIEVAQAIGQAIARWQNVTVAGFGPFDPCTVKHDKALNGYHISYAAYFRLNLARHLQILKSCDFLSETEVSNLVRAIEGIAPPLLHIDRGVLVHKDLALWNIMGTPSGIRAFIDWDDAIAGDPADDLSLLACFHSADVVQAAVDGYTLVRPLPDNFLSRFWLHLLRNMIVKAVIRCESGYFKQTAGGAFLMASGQNGEAFRKFTKERLLSAYRGLTGIRPLSDL
ncbi:MAG: aminoglycoside phosphotransferase family protein [Opitutaceae bacterium]|jgi:fructosamine-3-kinase|nr:aminoglycoside phosphotransferase family protein [Opitutaceae bacterium]